MRIILQFLTIFIASCIAVHGAELPQPAKPAALPLLPPAGPARLVQRELLTLLGYTVFDYLTCKQLEDGSLLLVGQVTNAALRKSAEDAASAVAGSLAIVNRIEVLPISERDQRLRSTVYSHVYGDDGMAAYAIRKIAPIHIIVKNGQVTLEGVVDTGVDRMHAESAAGEASASVTNHLIAAQDAGPLVTSMWSHTALTR